jgi:hypothetical protein
MVQSWRKLLPDLDDDLRGSPNEQIRKSEILEMESAVRSFENTDKDNEEWLKSDACKAGFQDMTDTLSMLQQNIRVKIVKRMN